MTNQCDGCRRKMPLNKHGNHINPRDSRDAIGCTAHLYLDQPKGLTMPTPKHDADPRNEETVKNDNDGQAAPPLPHKTVRVKVWADVDEGIAGLVERLNEIQGVTTHSSCQGTIGEGGASPYVGYVMATWANDATLDQLREEFIVMPSGENWGYIRSRVTENYVKQETNQSPTPPPGESTDAKSQRSAESQPPTSERSEDSRETLSTIGAAAGRPADDPPRQQSSETVSPTAGEQVNKPVIATADKSVEYSPSNTADADSGEEEARKWLDEKYNQHTEQTSISESTWETRSDIGEPELVSTDTLARVLAAYTADLRRQREALQKENRVLGTRLATEAVLNASAHVTIAQEKARAEAAEHALAQARKALEKISQHTLCGTEQGLTGVCGVCASCIARAALGKP